MNHVCMHVVSSPTKQQATKAPGRALGPTNAHSSGQLVGARVWHWRLPRLYDVLLPAISTNDVTTCDDDSIIFCVKSESPNFKNNAKVEIGEFGNS